MNHLNREVRVNKNGVPVTKLVRNGSPAATNVAKSIPVVSAAQDRKRLGQQLVSLIFTLSNGSEQGHVILRDAYGNDDGNEYDIKHVFRAVDRIMEHDGVAQATQSVVARGRFSRLGLSLIGEQFYEHVYEYCSNRAAGERTERLSSQDSYHIVDGLLLAETAVDFTPPGDRQVASALSSMKKASKVFHRRAALGYNSDEPEYAEGLQFTYLLTELTGAESLPVWVHKDEVLDTSVEHNAEFKERMTEVNDNYDLIKEHQDVCRDRQTIDIGLLRSVNASETPALVDGIL